MDRLALVISQECIVPATLFADHERVYSHKDPKSHLPQIRLRRPLLNQIDDMDEEWFVSGLSHRLTNVLGLRLKLWGYAIVLLLEALVDEFDFMDGTNFLLSHRRYLPVSMRVPQPV